MRCHTSFASPSSTCRFVVHVSQATPTVYVQELVAKGPLLDIETDCIRNSRFIFTTCIDSAHALLSKTKITIILILDATLVTLSDALLPLSLHPETTRIVLVGDPNLSPSVHACAEDIQMVMRLGERQSLQTTLYELLLEAGAPTYAL